MVCNASRFAEMEGRVCRDSWVFHLACVIAFAFCAVWRSCIPFPIWDRACAFGTCRGWVPCSRVRARDGIMGRCVASIADDLHGITRSRYCPGDCGQTSVRKWRFHTRLLTKLGNLLKYSYIYDNCFFIQLHRCSRNTNCFEQKQQKQITFSNGEKYIRDTKLVYLCLLNKLLFAT